jgi:hypothetical protein
MRGWYEDMKNAVFGCVMELICVAVRILMILFVLLVFGKLNQEERYDGWRKRC